MTPEMKDLIERASMRAMAYASILEGAEAEDIAREYVERYVEDSEPGTFTTTQVDDMIVILTAIYSA